MSASARLLQQLADGRFHSGQKIAAELGVTRTAVWKQVRRLQTEFGIQIDAVRGRGYRLVAPLELLDAQRIGAQLGADGERALDALHLLAATDSTNADASRDMPQVANRARVWLAEHQTAGRGRRGRSWVSTFGQNLYLSLAWRFELPMGELAGLSLAAGVVLAEVLADNGLAGHSLKWPNDLLVDQRKLAGILVEVAGEADGPAVAVVGIGLNFHLPAGIGSRIDQPWIDLRQAGAGHISRNRLAGRLIDALIGACGLFASDRLAPFIDRWHRFDGLRGRSVQILRGTQTIEGVYRGITASGAMVIENQAGRSEHHAGEVSLRGGLV